MSAPGENVRVVTQFRHPALDKWNTKERYRRLHRLGNSLPLSFGKVRSCLEVECETRNGSLSRERRAPSCNGIGARRRGRSGTRHDPAKLKRGHHAC
jgi:hypothetical protein